MCLYKNVVWTVLSRYGAQGLSVAANILLVRYLGADGYGEYALAASVMLIGNAFTNFGMDMILIRRLSSVHDSYILADGLWLQLFLSALFVAGTFLAGYFISIPLSLQVYAFSLFPLAFYSVFTIAIRARQQMQIYSIAQVMVAALHLISVFIVWLLRGDVMLLVLLLLGSHVVVVIWGFAYPEARITHLRFSLPKILALLMDCSHMAVMGVLRLVYEKIPVTVLPAFANFSTAGFFSTATRVVDAGKLGHLSAFTAMYPEMARDEDFGKRMKGLRPLLGAAVLIAAFLSLFAEPVITILFGVEFLSAILPLRIMAWGIVPYVLVTYIAIGLVALGFERTLLTSRFLILISLIVLLFVLTPQFGLTGSAAAVLIAELIHAALLWRLWRMHVLSKLS